MQRVLSVSLSHALRSAAFLILPFSFIALVAWATAGSASGSTTDPIRGAIWIWLGAHHIPFQLALPPMGIAGYLTYLPIGAILLPFFVVRTSFLRALDRLKGDYHDLNSVRLIFSSLYAVLATALAFASRSESISPQWYLAPVFTFLIALFATMTVGVRMAPSHTLKIASRILAVILGVSLIAVSILIWINFSQVKAITISLQPGIFGGALLLLLNILYLPNAAIALAAYFSGTGLAVGAGTIVSPWWYELGQIPALPLLGILPVDRQPLALIGIAFFIAIGALLAYLASGFELASYIQTFIFVVVGLTLLAYLGSGSLITTEMGAVGVSIWKFALSIIAEIGLGFLATSFILTKMRT
jgi:hypothetical protein